MVRGIITAVLLSLLFGPLSVAQSAASPDTNPTIVPTPADPPARNPAPKKIWTNENLAGAGGKVSVVGDARRQKDSAHPSKSADEATVSRIRENLHRLESELDGVKQQLASFKEFQEGEPVSRNGMAIPTGTVRVPVNQQIPALEERKKKLQGEIDDLLDEARKKGIEPGQLR